MDLTEGSETSANINQTLGKHPKVNTVNTEHTESLKSRKSRVCFMLVSGLVAAGWRSRLEHQAGAVGWSTNRSVWFGLVCRLKFNPAT
jgi:hypothetical protein